jgi:hypothetical protein
VRHRAQCDAGDADNAVGTANCVSRPDIRRQQLEFLRRLRSWRDTGVMDLFRVPRAGRVRVHIRSGALTPRMAKPLAMTCRVA